MSDQPQTPAGNGADQPAGAAASAPLPPLVINGQYIKDLSFEVPGAPAIFTRMNQQPDIPIQVDVKARHLEGAHYEVVLHVSVEAKVGAEAAFLLELAYGAVVQVNPVEPDHLQPLLFIEAPRVMFPFARAIISDVTRDGGFPPLMLQPIDFVQMFRVRLQQAQQAEAQAASAAEAPQA